MIHLGDIRHIDGGAIPTVDVICGGSPCQNFSDGGNREGLLGGESSLFYEMVRVIREMRVNDGIIRTDELIRPRFVVFENVPGVLTTHGGEDFRQIIEAYISIVEPRARVCVCVPRGGWTRSGCYYSDDGRWSLAWRVHDAQFWGVPQSRRRLSLVVDYGGISAPEILFERKRHRGDDEESEAPTGAIPRGTDDYLAFVSSTFAGWKRSVISSPLRAKCGDYGGGSETMIVSDGRLRRMTPTEYERLQGFPDGWTDVGDWVDARGHRRHTSDTARYHALGNSLALPFWAWVLKRISAQYVQAPTLGSLFDGIGGFPLIWARINGADSVRWNSEVDDFCEAVTTARFGDGEHPGDILDWIWK